MKCLNPEVKNQEWSSPTFRYGRALDTR